MAEKRYADSPLGSASHAFAVTPDDTAELAQIPRALFVGTGGDLAVQLADDAAAVTLANVPSGAVLDIQPRLVKATNTTATDIVALC